MFPRFPADSLALQRAGAQGSIGHTVAVWPVSTTIRFRPSCVRREIVKRHPRENGNAAGRGTQMDVTGATELEPPAGEASVGCGSSPVPTKQTNRRGP
ncbi:MAG: hypothetical protein CMJ59_25765 [Planctomycetaceae bacterium]|nr:hypothetical protein [Planctomycetaceae bacterium]